MAKQSKKNNEMKVYGRHAALKVFENRPEDIVRAYVTQDGTFLYKDVLKYLADNKHAYHVVEKEELEALTKATHHENICLLIKTKPLPKINDLLNQEGRSLILCLEEVENPHNLGAIMRSAAHFGVTGILYQAKVPVANSASAIRTAEGGAEAVPALHLDNWNDALDLAKKAGFRTFATSSHDGESLYETDFPDRTLLFLGAEGEGMSERIMKKMNHLLSIPGTGFVESLNVSNATTAILTEWYRQGIY